jgi:hypothetical protein
VFRASRIRPLARCFIEALCLALAGSAASGAGVTIITHGFNGNVTDWIIPLSEKMPLHPGFRGTNFSCFQITVTRNGQGQLVTSRTFLGGAAPLTADAGEILVKLDWSAVAGAFEASSTEVAAAVVPALLNPGFIPELGGRPLAELPLHLVGHSRGASVISEMTRLLGAQGVWVDQVTTLDPRPVPAFGDADVRTYANVLFADNYWQNLGDGLFVPNGMAISGAYNRRLTSLNGGYSSSHSDVHLWYHGTADLATPTTDTQANLTSSERATWWTTAEQQGSAAGYLYSRNGGGDRLSNLEPAGAGNGRISDGFNKRWELGGGLTNNRAALPANNSTWPNLLRFFLTETNPVPAGGTVALQVYHQNGPAPAQGAEVAVFLDTDFNPFNGSAAQLFQTSVLGTGSNNVGSVSAFPVVPAAATLPGTYAVFAKIFDGVRTRYLYAPQRLVVTPSRLMPVLLVDSLAIEGGQLSFTLAGFTGQRVVIEASTNLVDWQPISTNVFPGPNLVFEDAASPAFTRRFYRFFLTE